MSNITLDQAQTVISTAIRKSSELGVKANIAVVDAGANLIAFARMDGAYLGSIDIAMKKARTAKLFDMDTGFIGKYSQPGGPLYGVELTNGGLVSFAGGVPVKNAQGQVIGAVGVSGSMVEQDQVIAQAAATAVSGV